MFRSIFDCGKLGLIGNTLGILDRPQMKVKKKYFENPGKTD